jgi:hypothetical protein
VEMGPPVTAILVPVLGRPDRVRPLVENIEAVTPEPHWIYFAAGTDDPETVEEIVAVGSELGQVMLCIDGGDTWPNRINGLFIESEVEGCDYIFTGADDLLFHEHWLSEAMVTMRGMAQEGVVVVEDLHNPAGTMALISRRYINELGGTADGTPGVVMHPGYCHNWSDTELFAVAKARGCCARALSSVVEHLHHENGRMPFDDTYAKGLADEPHDRALFLARRALIANVGRGVRS